MLQESKTLHLRWLQTYRCMAFIIMFIHKLPWNHFSTVLALLEITSTMYRMQVNVRRWDLSLTDEKKETYNE
jgi:predicted transcriptional regulator